MPDFNMQVRTPARLEDSLGTLSFDSLESAYLDVMSAIPTTAAELLGDGQDPMRCSYLICDTDGALLMEVPFSERLRRAPRHPASHPLPPPPSSTAVDDARILRSEAALLRRQAAVLVRAASLILTNLARSHYTFARQLQAAPVRSADPWR